MKEYKKENNCDQRFSLHDANIIGIKNKDNNLLLKTQYGFVDIIKNEPVFGNIKIEDVHFEDSYAYIMKYKNVLCGNKGKFKGKKMSLNKFVKYFEKNHHSFEIISEYTGYKTILLNGFFLDKKDIYEINLEVFYEGDFIYQIDK